jgi:hypothetical protein
MRQIGLVRISASHEVPVRKGDNSGISGIRLRGRLTLPLRPAVR